MNTKLSVAATIALALSASPLSAQILPRGDRSDRTGTSERGRIESVQDAIEAARRRAGVYGEGTRSDDSRDSRVPKGHLPPRGMCRVWIDGVPPGHQPAVTSCSQAERDRLRYGANARVIYGDRESFPGKGKGKWERDDDRWDDRVFRGDDDEDSDRGKAKSKAAKERAKAAKKAAKKGRG